MFIQVMTWSTMIITPLTLLYPEVKKKTLYYEFFVDGVWCLEILLSLIRGNKNKGIVSLS